MLYDVTYMDKEYITLEHRAITAEDIHALLRIILESDMPDGTAQISIEIHDQ